MFCWSPAAISLNTVWPPWAGWKHSVQLINCFLLNSFTTKNLVALNKYALKRLHAVHDIVIRLQVHGKKSAPMIHVETALFLCCSVKLLSSKVGSDSYFTQNKNELFSHLCADGKLGEVSYFTTISGTLQQDSVAIFSFTPEAYGDKSIKWLHTALLV